MYCLCVYILACLLYIRELQLCYHFYLLIFYVLPLKYNRASPGIIGELNNLRFGNGFLTSLTRAKPQFFFPWRPSIQIRTKSTTFYLLLDFTALWLAGEKDIQSRNLQLFMPRKFAFSSLKSEMRIVLKNIRGFSNLDILHKQENSTFQNLNIFHQEPIMRCRSSFGILKIVLVRCMFWAPSLIKLSASWRITAAKLAN